MYNSYNDINNKIIMKAYEDFPANSHSEQKVILCISDIHLSADDSYSQFKDNKEYLHNFLNIVKLSPTIKGLVINGDLFDQWFIPAQSDSLENKSLLSLLKAISNNNKEIINDINNIISEGKIKVTYIPGNHDLIFSSSEISSIFPGIFQARDAFGLGSYTPDDLPNVIIEHGHRYDFFCAPYNISKERCSKSNFLPPAYFYARIAATSFLEGFPKKQQYFNKITSNNLDEMQELYYLYWNIWIESLKKYPILESYDEKIITATINDYKEIYSINDFLPYQLVKHGPIYLKNYSDIMETWLKRQLLNNVSIPLSIKESLTQSIYNSYIDTMSEVQYFDNPANSNNIVVFGHTHYPCLTSYLNNKSNKCIYANCGSWVDSLDSSNMTFVAISYDKTNSITVTLNKFTVDNTVEEISCKSLTNSNI